MFTLVVLLQLANLFPATASTPYCSRTDQSTTPFFVVFVFITRFSSLVVSTRFFQPDSPFCPPYFGPVIPLHSLHLPISPSLALLARWLHSFSKFVLKSIDN